MFEPVDPRVSFPKLEEKVLEYWRKEKILAKVADLRKDAKPFVFFEGPPTANGQPGIHHVEARSFKDLIPRFQTMMGKRVDRKAGWDTHGLPVELQVEKKLGLKNKKDIEAYGIAKFNAECRQDVWTYKEAWEKLTERIGFWLDMDHPYITYENDYIESVWAILKHVSTLHDPAMRPVLYQGHKVVPYCPRCGTALSSHEVAQGYKKVSDTSVYVKFQLTEKSVKLFGQKKPKSQIPNPKIYILAWTTTPWTLPGNVALAVGNDIEYVVVQVGEEQYIVAKDRAKDVQQIVTSSAFQAPSPQSGEGKSDVTHTTPSPLRGEGQSPALRVARLGEGEVLPPTSYHLQASLKGSDLVGLEYEPLFPGVIKDNGKAFRVYEASFVTTEDGTGVVHTAVMYGEDDYNLGLEVGLPTEHSVGEDGVFLPHTGDLAGHYVKDKTTEELILDHLESRGLLLKSVPYEHDYPFCWRCDTALLYYARTSWFIRMSEFRDEMVRRNNAIHWEPDTIRNGRMGEWLEGAKDWAISRERYWGTPLPFWMCEDGHLTVVSSLDELNTKSASKSHIYYMRHGQSEKNLANINSSWPEPKLMPLTELGKEQARVTAAILKDASVDLIISSDILRAKQTAEIVSESVGAEIIYDPRLREIDTGEFNGKNIHEPGGIRDLITKDVHSRFFAKPKNGESLDEARLRMLAVVEGVKKKYPNKTVLLVSHGDPILALELAHTSKWGNEMIDEFSPEYIKPGEARELHSANVPLNEKGEADLHRPYIDDINIICDHCGKVAQRVPEVADVWLDSGSMPFAQNGYPQKPGSEELLREHYPADYISEAIDQTRGWFYTLLAVATLMGEEVPYKNVICLGHVLDDHGKKMSKSKGNIVDPWQMINQYGADALRFYFYSVNPAGEPKLFTEKDVQTVQRRVLLLWWNVYSFFVTYANQTGWKNSEQQTVNSKQASDTPDSSKSQSGIGEGNILDQWVIARLNHVTKHVTESLEKYDVLSASRSLAEFIDDLSTWYLRRSRSRFSETADASDQNRAFQTLHHVLTTLSQLMAPFTPFLAEEMHRNLAGSSVHLADWPEGREFDQSIIQTMKQVRSLVSNGLEARMQAGVKVRQKLGTVIVHGKANWDTEIKTLIADELNVNEVHIESDQIQFNQFTAGNPKYVQGGTGNEAVLLDTTMTPELEREGLQRELIRAIQDLRKNGGLSVADRALVHWTSDDTLVNHLFTDQTTLAAISASTRSDIEHSEEVSGDTIELNGHQVVLSLSKL